MKKEFHNVAIAEIWTKHFELCSFTNRTSGFERNVFNFYDSLIDLDDNGKAIASKVKKYYVEEYVPRLNKLIEAQTGYTTDESTIKEDSDIIRMDFVRNLFKKIVQTIQDSGIAWQSTKSERQRYELSGYMGRKSE